jgi:transcriptional regulator with XRE-family HTH domain
VSPSNWIDVTALGRRISQRRERIGIRQAELARRAELSEAYVNRLEHGVVRNPKVNDLAQIAGTLQVPLSALIQDSPIPLQSDLSGLLAQSPRLSVLLARITRGLQVASHEDRQFILEYLEVLARHFGEDLEAAHA